MNRRHLLALAIGCGLVAITAVTFRECVRFEFVAWDDDLEITNNPSIRGLGLENLKWMFTDVDTTLRYVPLSWITWAMLHAWAGLDPAAFHGLNVVLHLVNVLLVFLLIRSLLEAVEQLRLEDRNAERSPWPPAFGSLSIALAAGLGALVWAVHPLRAEVVAWATHARYAQSLAFFLAAVLLYLRAARGSPPPAFQAPSYWASVVAGAASSLSYATGTVLVFALIALDLYPLRRIGGGSAHLSDADPKEGADRATVLRGGRTRRVLLEKAPFVAVPAFVSLVTLLGRLHAKGIWPAPAALSSFGVLPRVMQAFYIWSYYVWKPCVPRDLSPVYTRLVDFDPFEPAFLASAGLVLGTTLLAIVLRRRIPSLLALWFCHLAVLVPVLGLTEHPHYANDRYSYLQGILWSIAVAGMLIALRRASLTDPAAPPSSSRRWLTRGPWPFAAGCALVFFVSLPLAVLAHRQSLTWRDSITLFETMLERLGDDPYRDDIVWRLGLAHITRGKGNDDAIGAALLMQHPAPPNVLAGAGRILLERRHPEEAASLLARAALRSPLPSTYTALGIALLRIRKPLEAAGALSRALELEPSNMTALEYLGIAHMAQGEVTQAIRELGEVVRRDPKNAGARRRLEAALAARAPGHTMNPRP